jgi:hypothetical protein
MIELCVEGSLGKAGLVVSFAVREWVKALLASAALAEVASLDVSSPKDVMYVALCSSLSAESSRSKDCKGTSQTRLIVNM